MELKPRDPKKGCICRKCVVCHHFRSWTFENKDGLKEVKTVCSFDVLYDVIPKLIGSIDGVQRATNETRNNVDKFGIATVQTFSTLAQKIPNLLKR